MASKQKDKATLYDETLKVEEKKVSLFFHLEAIWRSYSQFVIFGGFTPYHKFYRFTVFSRRAQQKFKLFPKINAG